MNAVGGGVVLDWNAACWWGGLGIVIKRSWVIRLQAVPLSCNYCGQSAHTHVPLSPIIITW